MIVIVMLILLFYIIIFILSKKNKNLPKEQSHGENFAILIPARDESKVIESLLKSIQNQTQQIDMKNVYVIIEDKNDQTVEICKKYQTSIFIRRKLHLRKKGYALDECLKEIYQKNYDAYFIFDADNILDKDFIKNMIPIYQKGYDLGVGYRNIKNGKKVIPASSALIFSVINTLANKQKTKDTRNITISGTGFYIRGKWIQKWKGFPFHELTEDYELYLYSIVNNMTSFYNTKSIFYDEQPNTYHQYFIQRQRWIRGYLNARKKYRKEIMKSIKKDDPNKASKILEIIGLVPIIIPILGGIYPLLYHIIKKEFVKGMFTIMEIYIVLVVITIYILIKERKELAIEKSIKWKVALYHPILLISYIPCFFSILIKKDVEWKKIEHIESEIDMKKE